MDSPTSRLSKRITRKPRSTKRFTQSIGQATSCPPSPITSRSGSPSPYSSYSIVIPLLWAAVMPQRYSPLLALHYGGPHDGMVSQDPEDPRRARPGETGDRAAPGRDGTTRHPAGARSPTCPSWSGASMPSTSRWPVAATASCRPGSTRWSSNSARWILASRPCRRSWRTRSASWATTSTRCRSGRRTSRSPTRSIEAVLDAQERLASEQARYQIAFREDLARLAEQLRRPRG